MADLSERVVVPQFIGLPILHARGLANVAEVILTSGEPDGPPLGSRTWPGRWVVTEQDPEAGGEIARHGYVRVRCERRDDGGESGDREPRAPTPPEGQLALERRLVDEGGDR